MRLSLPKQTAEFVLVDLSEPLARYLVVRDGGARLKLIAKGQLPGAGDPGAGDPGAGDPGAGEASVESTLARQLREELREKSIACNRAALLLSRPTIDTVTDTLPPSSEEDLPALVANLVAQETDDADSRTIDFLVTGCNDDGVDVLAMTCDKSTIADHIKDFKNNGFSLRTITYAGLGAVELLGQVAHQKQPVAVAITFTNQITKIAVLHHGRPLLFRTLQRGVEPTPAYGAELAAELQRTLAFIAAGDEDSAQVYLIGQKDDLIDVASSLADTISSSVSIASALDQADASEIASFTDAASYANLIGVASAILNGHLELDFIRPREVAKPPSPWRRVAFWSSIAAGVLAVLGYMVYSDQSEQLEEIQGKKASLKRFAKRANKSMELQDIVDAVHQWQRSDIAWLDEMRELSERFPTQSESLVKRMSMSAGPDGSGVIDVSVQVQSPDIVTKMESAIRDERHSVSSKRVAEVTDSDELNWSFDTRIVFRPLPRPDLVLDSTEAANSESEEPAE